MACFYLFCCFRTVEDACPYKTKAAGHKAPPYGSYISAEIRSIARVMPPSPETVTWAYVS
jgi:hypothetical protein